MYIPHDLYDHFDEQWERDLADGYESITQADTIEELAQKAGFATRQPARTNG